MIEALDLVTGERLYRLSERQQNDRNSRSTRFVAIPRTEEHGGCENKCFTHYVQDTGGRDCLRGPMVQSDAEWLANKMNTQLNQPKNKVRNGFGAGLTAVLLCRGRTIRHLHHDQLRAILVPESPPTIRSRDRPAAAVQAT